MSMTHVTAVRNDQANLVVGNSTTFTAGTNQKIKLYSGTPPANAAAALSGNAVVATISSVVWGAASGGVATVTSSAADTNAVGGVATFFRIYKTAGADPADCIDQGTVGTSGADMIINNTTISAGATVTLNSGSYTAPP